MTGRTRRKVFIVGHDALVSSMFEQAGFQPIINPYLADLAVFTGGADVDPELYGEKNVRSHIDKDRDTREGLRFNMFREEKIPMVGICRGGQFLNVKSGGRMIQHVDLHTSDHYVWTDEGNQLRVTSTHHQAMIPGDNAEVLAVAVHRTSHGVTDKGTISGLYVPEIVFYDETSCLCFQPHPEYAQGKECRGYFFYLIKEYLNVE